MRLIFNKRVVGKVTRKVNKKVVRPAVLFGLEIVARSKGQEAELDGGRGVKHFEILFESDKDGQGLTGLEISTSERHPWLDVGDIVREARLRCFGPLQRRDSGYIGIRVLKMELWGRRQRCEDMQIVGVTKKKS